MSSPLRIPHSLPFSLSLLLLLLFLTFHSTQHHHTLTSAQSSPNTFTPLPVWGAAYARTATRLFVLSGNPTSTTVMQASDQFMALDLTTSWTATNPAWTQLTAGPTQITFPATFSADGKIMYAYHIPIQSSSTTSVYQYTLATGKWTPVMNAPTPSGSTDGVTAVADPNTGIVYFATADIKQLNNGTLNAWDPNTGQTTTSTLPLLTVGSSPTNVFAMRSYYSNVWSIRRKTILYFGGVGNPSVGTDSTVAEYSPSMKSWRTFQATGATPPPRTEHCAASNDDGTLMIIYGGRYVQTPVSGNIYILNTVTGNWINGTAGAPRLNTICTIAGDLFLAWGGLDGNGQLAPGSMLIYNIATNQWVTDYAPPASYPKTPDPLLPPGGLIPTSTSTPTPTPTPTTGSGDEKPGSNLAAIIGAIIAALVLVAVIIGYILYRRRQRQRKCKEEGDVKMVISLPTMGIEYDEPSGVDSEDSFGPGVNEGYRLQTPYSKLAGPQGDLSVARTRGGVDFEAVPGFHQPSIRYNPHTSASLKPAHGRGPMAITEEKEQDDVDEEDDGEVFEKNLKNIDNQQRLLDMQRQLLVLQQQQGHQVTRSAPQEGSPTKVSNDDDSRRRMTPPGSRAPQHGSPSDANSGVWEMMTPETRAPQHRSLSNSVAGVETERPTLPDPRAPQHGSPSSAVSGAAWEMMTPETRAPQHVQGKTDYLPPPPPLPVLKPRTKRAYYPPPPPTVQTYAVGPINGNETGNEYDCGYGYGYGDDNSPMPPPTYRGGHNPQTFL